MIINIASFDPRDQYLQQEKQYQEINNWRMEKETDLTPRQ